jgi:hypothetical protein
MTRGAAVVGAVGTTPRHERAGENGQWAGCPGGFGLVL